MLMLNEYVLDPDSMDVSALAAIWASLIPVDSFTVWLVNRFGDMVLVFEEGSVHLLDVGSGVLTQIGSSREDFMARTDESSYARDWLMIPLVDSCRAVGTSLAPNQCYGFKVPPCIGGTYVVENVAVMTHDAYNTFLCDLQHQLSRIPDGTKVRIEVT